MGWNVENERNRRIRYNSGGFCSGQLGIAWCHFLSSKDLLWGILISQTFLNILLLPQDYSYPWKYSCEGNRISLYLYGATFPWGEERQQINNRYQMVMSIIKKILMLQGKQGCLRWICSFIYLFIYFKLINLFNWRLFTLQYCSGFCHTLTWISHGCTCVPHPKSHSHLPPHPISQHHPSVSALSTLSHASNLDWRSISHMIIYMFQCYSLKSSHPRLLPQSPKDGFALLNRCIDKVLAGRCCL